MPRLFSIIYFALDGVALRVLKLVKQQKKRLEDRVVDV